MKKIIMVFWCLTHIMPIFGQVDFRRDKTFDPPYCIGSGFSAALLDDGTIIISHHRRTVTCALTNQYDFFARINSKDGSLYDEFWSHGQMFARTFTYAEPFVYYHGNGAITGERFRAHKEGWIDSSYFRTNLIGLDGWQPFVAYLPKLDRVLLPSALTDSTALKWNVNKHFVMIDREGNFDTSIRFPTVSFGPQPDSILDHQKGVGSIFDDEVNEKIYFGTKMFYADGHFSEGMFRMNYKGEIDKGFTFSRSMEGCWIFSFAGINPIRLQKNGKLVFFGGFIVEEEGQEYWSSMIRLNLDGSFDPSFNTFENTSMRKPFEGPTPTAIQMWVEDMVYWKEGMYIITGPFTEYQGKPRSGIAVVNEDGFLVEEYFADGQGFKREGTSWINTNQTIVVEDTLYILGLWTSFDDEPNYTGIIRLTLQDLNTHTEEPGSVSTPIKVFPNPTSDQLTVDLAGLHNFQRGFIRIISMQGSDQMQVPIEAMQQIQVNMQHLPPGLYRLQVHGDNRILDATTFVKQ